MHVYTTVFPTSAPRLQSPRALYGRVIKERGAPALSSIRLSRNTGTGQSGVECAMQLHGSTNTLLVPNKGIVRYHHASGGVPSALNIGAPRHTRKFDRYQGSPQMDRFSHPSMTPEMVGHAINGCDRLVPVTYRKRSPRRTTGNRSSCHTAALSLFGHACDSRDRMAIDKTPERRVLPYPHLLRYAGTLKYS